MDSEDANTEKSEPTEADKEEASPPKEESEAVSGAPPDAEAVSEAPQDATSSLEPSASAAEKPEEKKSGEPLNVTEPPPAATQDAGTKKPAKKEPKAKSPKAPKDASPKAAKAPKAPKAPKAASQKAETGPVSEAPAPPESKSASSLKPSASATEKLDEKQSGEPLKITEPPPVATQDAAAKTPKAAKAQKAGAPKAPKAPKAQKAGGPKAPKSPKDPSSAESTEDESPKSLQGSKSDLAAPKSPKAKKKSTGSDSPKSAATEGRKTPKDKAGKKAAGKGAGKGGKKVKSAGEGKTAETSTGHGDQALPEGVIPIFLTSRTQEIFDLRVDEDVTAEDPYKYIKKEDILKDLHNRAAVSDFHAIRQLMMDYAGEEIFIVYDQDFKHGQNFFIATTEEAKQLLLKEVEEEEMEEEEEVSYTYIPPVAKAWTSQGSEKEVEEESVVEHRKTISVLVVRPRREFGAPFSFSDRNATDIKNGYVECPPFEDTTFDITRMLQDKGIQSVPKIKVSAAQTDFKRPINAAVQTKPREYSEEEQDAIVQSPEMESFVKAAAPRMEVVLQQNEIMNIFFDDWASLTAEDGSFGSKADNHLKEFQSFTDLQFSKARTITCIDWHPTIKGVVAVSVGERQSFDERVDNAHKKILMPSLILIWSFTDPIHPQILLEAPDDIICFKFCPTEPNYVAGGCLNGQVVLWDISQHSGCLRQAKSAKTKDPLNALQGFEDDSALSTPIVRYCAVSSIDNSHQFPVTDLLWVPDHFEISRMGVPMENKSGQCCQIMTCASDHVVLLWDIRAPKQPAVDDKKRLGGVPTTFKHLDLVWKPHLKVTFSNFDVGGDHAPTRFTISERQGDRSCLLMEEEEKPSEVKATDTAAGGFAYGAVKLQSSAAKRTLTSVKTSFYVGTEDGELVFVDWMPQKDQESGKFITPKPEYFHAIHGGPIVTLLRSPFFKDVILCIGGWTFTLWKETVTTSPILQSSASSKRFTGGYWSPSRPAVFYITKIDGSIDIWDLLDRTHEPCMNQSVSSAAITYVYPFAVTAKQHLLAVGDTVGTLHILAIPWSLRQPTANELAGMANYIDREVKRRAFVQSRWEFREKEKADLDLDAKRKAGIVPQMALTDEEIEQRMQTDYKAYLEEELAFLRRLGMAEELPTPGRIPIEAN